ncbi:uncharacterized protein PGTG_16551 [Puccinia graminis f. sp. tritici CRL 75-36-700-3]|uniref:Uncharacterized protein n=1 Tax=Puccinia graminis f. sp. tritici (strain CRL 75-36-700-3 / race SCCL) TaxID=418459 RepID=E3L1V0_PUCGT|nr:uncharacterized protein PGTG_16551 [Puccinia graminis f. sp. tritici CRL 75-36-700-3]EFP90525.1 hypothetical protein PGTG_16551 [Puccinia graminis f. sp. tritici CRL 75-36-700-3]
MRRATVDDRDRPTRIALVRSRTSAELPSRTGPAIEKSSGPVQAIRRATPDGKDTSSGVYLYSLSKFRPSLQKTCPVKLHPLYRSELCVAGAGPPSGAALYRWPGRVIPISQPSPSPPSLQFPYSSPMTSPQTEG